MGVTEAPEVTPAHVGSDARDWTFGGTWPYEPRWLFTDGIRLHYVDEGPRDGEPVVLLHGNPTWSYLYRHHLRGLADAGFRAVGYDQLGFGRSDKPRSVKEYSVERHGLHLAALMDELELEHVTLVVHDWGGPIGLGWAAEHPERVRGLVLLNTFSQQAPSGRGPFRWPLARGLLVKSMHFYVRAFLLRGGLAHPERLGEDERTAYLAPHPSGPSRSGILAYTRLAPPALPLDGLRGKPALYVWGMRDRALGSGALRRLQERLPGETVELEDARSFVPEDAPGESLEAILDFLRRIP